MLDPLGLMLPPKAGDSDGNNRWQWTIWVKLWLLLGFAVWSLDMVPGFPGLARAADLKALTADVREARTEILETGIFDLRIKQCDPSTPGSLRQAYGEQLGRMLRSYRELTGVQYQLLMCADVR